MIPDRAQQAEACSADRSSVFTPGTMYIVPEHSAQSIPKHYKVCPQTKKKNVLFVCFQKKAGEIV